MHSSICKKATAGFLLLCVFLMMTANCPVRSLLASAFHPPMESHPENQHASNQHSAHSERLTSDDLRCSDGTVIEAALLDLSHSGKSSLPLPLLLTVISTYLTLSVLSLNFTPFKAKRARLLRDNVPLFLKKCSIII